MDVRTDRRYVDTKYDLYRALFFLESENKGRAITFEELIEAVGPSTLSPSLFLGKGGTLVKGFGAYNDINSYIRSQPQSELRKIAKMSFEQHSLLIDTFMPKIIGTYTHTPIELLIMMSLKLHGFTRGIKEELEVGGLHGRVDLNIPISATFLAVIGALNKIIPKGIKHIVVDFTHERKRSSIMGQIPNFNFIKKYYKQYQSGDRFLFIVLTHPSFSQSDIDFLNKDLKLRKPAFARNIKLVLLEDFLSALKVQEKIKSKVEYLYDLVRDCLQKSDPKLRKESFKELKELYELAKLILKFPLSQMKLTQFKGSFFNID